MVLFRSYASCAVALLIMLSTPLFSQAAPSISVEQTGVITGNELSGVAGIEFAISYDASLLSTPTVTKGTLLAKAMLVANTSIPGTIKVAILSLPPFSGSGQLASITFGSNSAKVGIKSITVSSMIDAKGVQIPVQYSVVPSAPVSAAAESATPVLISTPGIPFTSTTTVVSSPAQQAAPSEPAPAASTPSAVPVTPASTSTASATPLAVTSTVSASTTAATTTATIQTSKQSASTTTTSRKTPGQTVVNTVMSATDTHQEEPERKIADSTVSPATMHAPTQPEERKAVSDEPPSSTERKQIPLETSGQTVIFKSIADRFKAYRGDKSLPIMTALFRKELSKFIHQEPVVTLSDGKTGIKIIIDLPAGSTSSPNFALDNATFLSVKKINEINGRWIIEAMPDANAWKASLNIIAGADSFEYPLTVAPPIGTAIKADQAGWELFMKKNGSSQKLSYDFNHDGTVDYIDEFIFVANHLAAR